MYDVVDDVASIMYSSLPPSPALEGALEPGIYTRPLISST